MALPCMNCKKDVEPLDARVFADVFCCQTCHTVAMRMEDNIRAELNRMALMLREKIRIDMVTGKLHLATQEPFRETSKKDVLEAIIQLQEASNASRDSTGPGHPAYKSLSPPADDAAVCGVGPGRVPSVQARPVDLPSNHREGESVDGKGSAA